MSESPLYAYLGWLKGFIAVENGRSYDGLWDLLLGTEWVWLIPNDDNRIADGLDIRKDFFMESGLQYITPAEYPCSVLEVIIGLSRRLEFQAGGSAPGWAWQIVCNLELHKLQDPFGPRKAARAQEILQRLIYRNYNPDGVGGFFPLAWPDEDQRKVEVWYQLAAYVEEIHPEY